MPELVPAVRAAWGLPAAVVLVTTGSTGVDGQWDSGSAATRYPPYVRFRALASGPSRHAERADLCPTGGLSHPRSNTIRIGREDAVTEPVLTWRAAIPSYSQ